MSIAWRAYSAHGQIGPGTEFTILLDGWTGGKQPKLPSAGSVLTVDFPSSEPVNVDLIEISGDEAIIQTSDGAKWLMNQVRAEELLYSLHVPSDAQRTYWIVKERVVR
jgi:hypothetical protein